MTTRLDDWIAQHGALGPSAALVLALEMCALATRLGRAELASVLGSLRTTGVRRDERNGWTWCPAADNSPPRTVGDGEVLGRLGAVLFHAVTGEALTDPFAELHEIRAALRRLRPELSSEVTELIVAAILAGRGSGLTLDAFAMDVRRALGVERRAGPRVSRRSAGLTAAAGMGLALALAWWMGVGGRERPGAHGFTASETAVLDIIEESAQAFAIIEEHTAAIQEYQAKNAVMSGRVAFDDPRLAWNGAYEAWIRTLRGDRLTTEQILRDYGERLSSTLGSRHPYTRAARLDLARTLEARGAMNEAAALRVQGEQAARDVFQGTGLGSAVLEDPPVPPGVIAHVAPNAAVREGFRRRADGSYFTPLTSIQRWIAGRNGWRLHVIASASPCRVSLVVGNDPRRVDVRIARVPDGGWDAAISGTSPPLSLRLPATAKPGVSIVADAAGIVRAGSGGTVESSSIDTVAAFPAPPYGLTFDGLDRAGCEVVWLEIGFPTDAKVAAEWVRNPTHTP